MTHRLLYVSPVLPAATGNGLAMRAGTVLRALASRHRVSLLVVPIYASPAGLPPEIAACCEEVAVMPPGFLDGDRGALPRWARLLGASWPFRRPAAATPARPVFRDEPFDAVHVFRLAAVPFARPWLEASDRPRRDLDLDEVESLSRRRLAAVLRAEGATERAAREEIAAGDASRREADALAAFDRVYVCSERDRALLIGRGRAEVAVVPNALPVPTPLPPPPAGGPFRLLFVGTLGYPPNEAAALSLCREIVPAIRRRTARPVAATVAGGGAGPALRRAAAEAGVDLAGYVPDLAPLYRDAHVVVVPIRAGGGTRIKAIEAFAFRRPVVGTPLGVEGLAVADGEHVLLADDPDRIAGQCLRLLADRALAERIVERAWELFVSAYSTQRLATIVAALDDPPPPRAAPAADRRPVPK